MIRIIPRLAALVPKEESRTNAQIVAMGGDGAAGPGSRVAIRFDSEAGSRALLARSLLDFVVRLEPLVGEVVLSGPGEEAIAQELSTRYPVELEHPRIAAGVALDIGVGRPTHSADLLADGAGWVAALGTATDADDDGNPVGPLAAADFAAAEAFKVLFARSFPDSRHVREFSTWTGEFSAYAYRLNGESPRIRPIAVDGVLVGAGGVSAGVILVLGALGRRLSGRLALIDHDIVKLHNLNRLLYATVDGANLQRAEVDEARAYLAARSPDFAVESYAEKFEAYKARIPRRRDRRFPLIITGLDSDDARHEVQRETPCVLIDGATGSYANCRIERIRFGSSACLGCTRRSAGRPPGAGCDEFPDGRAPSISFLSALPGILAGGELIKHALGDHGALPGYFEHIFVNGPNEDMAGVSARRPDCQVGCGDPAVLAQFEQKCS